jgi:hypothetical protein
MDGINLADYRKFQRYTPTVNYSDAGTFEVVYGSFGPSSALTIEPTKAVALFCYRFAVETILFLKQNETLKEIPASKPKKKYRVVEKCDVIVWPCEQPEIIRKTEVGEILNGRADCYDKPDFFSVLHDGDGAYVKKSAVEPLGLEHESDPS